MKTIIERGASWTLEETKLLLSLWGQDLVMRQASNTKRTKECYERIAEKFIQAGFERTAEQVRTRVFNMIAEYRRILKDPNSERMRKCVFFDPLHKIYQAKHMDDVKSALDDYEPEGSFSPNSNTTLLEKEGDESISDSEVNNDGDNNGDSSINNNYSLNKNNNNNNSMTTNDDLNYGANSDKEASSAANINNNTNNNIQISNGPQAKKAKVEPKEVRDEKEHEGGDPIRINKNVLYSFQNIINTNSSKKPADTNANLKTPQQSSISTSQSKSTTNSNDASSSLSAQQAFVASSSSSTGAATTAPIPSTSSNQRHQSLLLPHSTPTSSATTTTPINKINTSGANNNIYMNLNSTKLPIIRTNQLIGHPNSNENVNGTTPRLPTTAAITSHQLYQAPVNTFDVTSSALLIDRMFAHLSRESENMREWIALEKERLQLERTRRAQEADREVRRERVMIDTLMKFQDQWLSFLSKIDPRIVEKSNETPPELKIPSKESNNDTSTTSSNTTNPTSQSEQTTTSQSTTTTTTSSSSSSTVPSSCLTTD